MMSSRKKAEKRLVGEQKQLDKSPVPGVSVGPKDDNLMEWNAFIFGEGEMFELELSFTNFYPLEAPKVKFLTKIDHPKIGEDGTVHLDILSDNWSPTYHIGEILKSIKELLSDAESESSVYQETAPAPQVNPNVIRLMQTLLNQNQNSYNLNGGELQEMKSESKFEAPDNDGIAIIMVLKTQLRDLKKLPKKDYECAVKVLSHLFSKLLKDPNNPKFRDLNLSKIRDKSISALEILYTVGFEQDGKGERLQFNVKNIDLINEANKLLTQIKMGKEIPCNCPNCLLKREIEKMQNKKCCCPRCRLKLQQLTQARAMSKENRNSQLRRYQSRMNDNWERKDIDNNDSNDSDDNDDRPCIIIFRNGNGNYQNAFQIESPFSLTVNGFSNNNNSNNNSDNDSETDSKSFDWSKQNGQYS